MKSKKLAYLKEENLLSLLSQNNFIIPEIQREYVWGNNKDVISRFLKELKLKFGKPCDCCKTPSGNLKVNIGFLYSYKPDYVKVEHDRFLDENLIDGQQRLTTLYLLLFFCALKESRKQDFITLIRFDGSRKMALDFKVRDLTRKFLFELIEKVENIDNIENQSWFLNDYRNDVSINSMISALGYIKCIFSDDIKYYNHIINNVVFWHFKTEATSQGEELYITMNARGEQLSNIEVNKASLFLNESSIIENGKRWEEWQHYFWLHKGTTNKTSDNGFNNFINCIAGLEYYLKDIEYRRKLKKYSDNPNSNDKPVKPVKKINKLLDFEMIKLYINALKYLNQCLKQISNIYDYSDWYDEFYNEVWDIINNKNTNWFVDYTHDNFSTQRRRMSLIWSWLLYYRQNSSVTPINFIRITRLYYVRYMNNNRSINRLSGDIDKFSVFGIMSLFKKSKIGNDEEKIKYTYLMNKSLKYESLIWKIEDHPLNIDGTGHDGQNISHLINIDSIKNYNDLLDIYRKFTTLFPGHAPFDKKLLSSILLLLGFIGIINHKTNYIRYEFSEWRSIIRDDVFVEFFRNYTLEQCLDSYLNEVIDNFLLKHKKDILNEKLDHKNLNEKFCILLILIEYDTFWGKGDHLTFNKTAPEDYLINQFGMILYNLKNTFQGDQQIDLWRKAFVKHDKKPLEFLKDRVNSI